MKRLPEKKTSYFINSKRMLCFIIRKLRKCERSMMNRGGEVPIRRIFLSDMRRWSVNPRDLRPMKDVIGSLD